MKEMRENTRHSQDPDIIKPYLTSNIATPSLCKKKKKKISPNSAANN